MFAFNYGVKVVETFILPWWWKPVRKVLPKVLPLPVKKKSKMPAIEPDGGGDQTVSN